MRKKKSSGLSLIEVLIASVILTGVMLAAFATLFTATTLSSKGSAASEVETRGTRFLGLCRDDMSAAQYGKTITLVAADPLNLGVSPVPPDKFKTKNLAVAYQIPGNRNNAGVQYAGGIVSFGYNAPFNLATDSPADNHPKFYEDLVCYLRYEPDTVFKESDSSPDAKQLPDWDTVNKPPLFPPFPTLDNPTLSLLPNQILNKDLNGDGDRLDTYVRGKIVKLVYAPFGSPAALAHPKGFSVHQVVVSNLLLSREVVSDNVMMRVRTEGPVVDAADILYTHFDKHDGPGIKSNSERDMMFRFVNATGGVEEAPYDSSQPLQEQQPTQSTNAKGILICVTHGDYDGTPGGFVVRKNRQLIRTKTDQANPGGVPVGP